MAIPEKEQFRAIFESRRAQLTRMRQQSLLSAEVFEAFRRDILAFYASHKRRFPWRDDPSPYHVLVSEIMLQQTQVERVVPFFNAFVLHFPHLKSLAEAPFSAVFQQWQGLGYNRRARFLHQSAQIIMDRYNGEVPLETEALVRLPGIGEATAASIAVFAYDVPRVFVETNIRALYLWLFFNDEPEQSVSEKEIRQLVSQSLPETGFREWYSALMDCGTLVKELQPGLNKLLRIYRPQSPFHGSRRQKRGRILKELSNGKSQQIIKLAKGLPWPLNETENIIRTLIKEGFLRQDKDTVQLK